MAKTMEEILKNALGEDDGSDVFNHCSETVCLKAMEEFGKQCFNAAKKQVNGDYESSQRTILVKVDKFENFKSYLKSISKNK